MEKKCASLVHILARRELGDRTPFSAGGVWCSTHQKNSSAQLSLYYDNHIRGECERGEILTFDRTPRSVPENPVGDECGYVIDKRMNLSVEGGTGKTMRERGGSRRWEETGYEWATDTPVSSHLRLPLPALLSSRIFSPVPSPSSTLLG
ncbi:hypothetical protein PUN28_017977 [Cardiocondyla obscurior]|uniref:Uncharacterized protein n=1 Tax=Cardiocondyla obscurior TaxID=286306 RepID=A0AAW2EHE2_9HYME